MPSFFNYSIISLLLDVLKDLEYAGLESTVCMQVKLPVDCSVVSTYRITQ